MTIKPNTVTSPQRRLKLGNIIYDGKDDSFSIAEIEWDGRKGIGIRWNGSKAKDVKGNPVSRGYPTWFVVPEELELSILNAVKKLK